MKSILLTILLLSLVACVPKVPKMPVSEDPVAVTVNLGEPTSLLLTSPLTNLSNQQVAEIEVFGVYPGAYVNLYTDPSCTYQIAGSKAEDTSIKLRTPTLADGTYTFYAQQHLDRVNISTCSLSSVTYTVETVKPSMLTSVDLNAPTVSPSNETMVNLIVTGAEIGATVNLYRDSNCLLQIDSKVATTTDVTFAASTTTDGNYLFYARQIDLAGNYSSCSADYALYKKDTVALKPSRVKLFDPTSAHSEDPTPELIVEGVEFGATVTLYTDASCSTSVVSGVATSTTINLTTPAFPLGNYYFYAKQVDAVGNESPCSTSYLYYTVAPPPPSALARKSPTVTPYNDNTLEVTISGTTPSATIKLYKDQACLQEVASGLATATSLDLTTPVLPDGGYTFYARQYYSATVYSNCSTASVDYFVDTTSLAPSPLFLKIPSTNHDELTTPTITASGIEVGSTIKLFTDATCSTQVASGVSTKTNIDLTVTPQVIGIYKFYAQQTDYLNNISTCSTSYVSYMVKPPAPTSLNRIAPVTSPDTSSTATVTVGGVIAGADVTLFTDPFCNNAIGTGVATGTTIDITTNTLAEASYTFYANQSFDAGVNFSDCSTASATYVRDISAKRPNNITLYDPSTSPSDDTTPTFTVWGIETGATVTIYSDSGCATQIGSAVSTTSSVNVTSTTILPMGLTPIYAKQVDALGNISLCSTAYFNYEVTPPPPTGIVLKNPTTTPNTIQVVDLTITGAENGSTVKIYTNDTCTSPVQAQGIVAVGNTIDLTVGSLPEGAYDFYATQTLNTNNTSICSSATVHYEIDLTALAPTSITFPGGTPSENQTPDVLVQPVEDGATVQIFSDATCTTSIGTGVATGTTITITSTATLAYGSHTIYASQVDALGNPSPCSGDKGDYTVVPPAPGDPVLENPTTSPNTATSVTIKVEPVISGATVGLFRDSNCTVSVTSGVAGSTSISLTDNTLSTDQIYQYYARQTTSGGFASACSAGFASYELDTTAVAPTLLTLRAPRLSPDPDTRPEVEIAGIEYGATVTLYKNSSCTDLIGTTVESLDLNTVRIIVNTDLPIGSYTFYAKQVDPLGNPSNCSTASVNYTVIAKPTSTFMLVPQNTASFNTLPSANTIHDVAVSPVNSNLVAVATDYGVGISTDGGSTYVTRTTADGLRFNTVSKVYIDHRGYIFIGYSPKGASFSHDGGNTFKTLAGTGYDDTQVVNGFYVHPLSNRIYIATNTGLYLSDDYGKTWSPRTILSNQGKLPSNIINKVWQSPLDTKGLDGIIIIATPAGICYELLNAYPANVFTCADTGNSNLIDDAINDFYYDTGNLMVFTDGGISQSNPSTDISNFNTLTSSGSYQEFYSNGSNWYLIRNGSELAVSTNSGGSWSNKLVDAISMSGSGGTVFAARPSGLGKSTNPNVWSTNSSTSSFEQSYITKVKRVGTKMFFAADKYLFYTTDSGSTYISQTPTADRIVSFDIARDNDNIRYVTTTGGEMVRTSDGSSYSNVSSVSGIGAVACDDSGNDYMFGRTSSNRVYWDWSSFNSNTNERNTSSDQNDTWDSETSAEINYSSSLRTRALTYGDSNYALGTNAGAMLLEPDSSTDILQTRWASSALLPDSNVNDIYISGTRYYVATDNGIALNRFGGNPSKWESSQGTNLDGKQVNAVYYDGTRIYAGTNNGLYVATSITGSWTVFTPIHGLPSFVITDIGEDSSGKMFIGTDQGMARER